MFADRIEAKWIDAFVQAFTLCKVNAGDAVAVLSESQSRDLNVQLALLALARLDALPFQIVVPAPRRRCTATPPRSRR